MYLFGRTANEERVWYVLLGIGVTALGMQIHTMHKQSKARRNQITFHLPEGFTLGGANSLVGSATDCFPAYLGQGSTY